MSRVLKNGLRFVLVTVGVVILTSFSIDATDTLKGSQTALSIFSQKITESQCSKGTTRVVGSDYDFCIDTYEASPSKECIYDGPSSVADTSHNIADVGCLPVSEEGKKPWTFVTQSQAEQLCAKAGKSLPTAQEWYLSAVGTVDNINVCNLKNSLAMTGLNKQCVSGVGAYDMIGNVWEIVKGDIVSGQFEQNNLPPEGYVDLVDSFGMAVNTTSTPNIIYNNDYFWSDSTGQYALMRGGYYGSKDDGGLYSTHAKTDKNFSSAAIGFRCVEYLQ